MKRIVTYSKGLLILYSLCLLKIISTFLYLSWDLFDFYYLTIISIPICLTNALHPNIALLCVIILMVTTIVWMFGILFALLGIKFINARKVSLVFFTIATILDLLSSFISPNATVVISCSVVSALVLIVCIMCFYKSHQ